MPRDIKDIAKKTAIGCFVIVLFLGVILTGNTMFMIIACQLLVYSFWIFVFRKKKTFGLFLVILVAAIVGVMAFKVYFFEEKSMIRTVAPYAFYDMGDFIEIKGGWNFSETKYESTAIVASKSLGVVSDHTARLIDGHLHVATMLWKVVTWDDDAIIAKSAIAGMYSDHFLYIDRQNKKAFILEKSTTGNPFDISDRKNLVITEELQDTFFQRGVRE